VFFIFQEGRPFEEERYSPGERRKNGIEEKTAGGVSNLTGGTKILSCESTGSSPVVKEFEEKKQSLRLTAPEVGSTTSLA